MTTAHGLRIACLGGIYEPNIYSVSESVHVRLVVTLFLQRFSPHPQGFTSPYFTNQTVEKLLANTMTKSETATKSKDTSYGSLAAIRASTASSQLIDILLTNTYPANVTAFSRAPLPSPSFPSPPGAEPIAEVLRRTKPRYHFAAGGGSQDPPMFWEREPIVWKEESDRAMRFVSLGAFGGIPTEGKKPRVSPSSLIWFARAIDLGFSGFMLLVSHRIHLPVHPHPHLPMQRKTPLLNCEVRKDQCRMKMGRIFGGVMYSRVIRGPVVVSLRLFPAVRNFTSERRLHVIEGEPGKPPAGYKCKICESPDVRSFISNATTC